MYAYVYPLTVDILTDDQIVMLFNPDETVFFDVDHPDRECFPQEAYPHDCDDMTPWIEGNRVRVCGGNCVEGNETEQTDLCAYYDPQIRLALNFV